MRHQHRLLNNLAKHHALLVALSDDLSLPLVQIKSGLELINDDNYAKSTVRRQALAMGLSVEAGLKLVEAYRLLLMSQDLANINFEPIAIGSVLEEVAHRVTPFAKEYSTKIEVDVQGRLTPVLIQQKYLSAALESLSFSMVRAQAAQSEKLEYRLVLGAHRSAENTVAAGVFSEFAGLSDQSLRVAHSLVGQARQPLPAVPPGTASGILVADMLCSNLWQPLRSAVHHSLGGLVTSLPISKQLQIV